jgi:hypothetical protein
MVDRLGKRRATEVWTRMAASAIRKAWIAENPEGSYAAQKVLEVDRTRVGQVCKYPLKPFGMVAAVRSREAAISLTSRRTNDPWGTWTHGKDRQGWRPQAEALLAADREHAGELERPKIEFGDATMQGVAVRAQTKGMRVYFGFQDVIGVLAIDVLAGIQRDPRSFQRQSAEAGTDGALQATGPPGGGPVLPSRPTPSAGLTAPEDPRHA